MKAKVLINPYGHELEGMMVDIVKEYKSNDDTINRFHMYRVIFDNGVYGVFHSHQLELENETT